MAEISDNGLILGILSVTLPQYVFLAENGTVLIEKKLVRTRMTGNRIVPSVKSCLDELNLGIESVDTFLALSGPGSMTGIRAGLAPIRAWAWASGKNVLMLPTLPVLASGFTKPTLALISAGRNRWWGQAFSGNMNDTPRIMNNDRLEAYDKPEWTWVSPNEPITKNAKVIKHAPTPQQVVEMINITTPSSWTRAIPQYLFEMEYNG